MRILLASLTANPLPSPEGDGPWSQSIHLAELATCLSAAGHQVTVAARHDAPHRPNEVWMAGGVRVVNLEAGPRRPQSEDELINAVPDFTAQLHGLVDDLQPELIHSHRWITGRAALPVAWNRRLPLVHTSHGLHQQEAGRGDGGLRASSEATLVRRASHLFSSSSSELFELVRLGASMSAVTVVPPAVDLKLFNPEGEIEPGSRNRLVAVGRMTADRGFADAVSALAHLPEASLVVAGGPGSDDIETHPVTKELARLARDLGVADRLEIRGRTRRAELARLLRSSAAALCLPAFEPSGLAPVEAMACGVPVIATTVGGHSDVVVDEITGIHVQPGRVDQIVAAARRLLSEPAVGREMGTAGRDRVERRYGWDRVIGAVIEGYERCLAGHPSSRALPSG